MIEIYVNGCSTCGVNAGLIAQVKRTHPEATVYNTRYDTAYQLQQHVRHLVESGMGLDTYAAIVVEDGGKVVTLLKEWK